jgi:branched-subunit amino acid aminotransferase/4-amino-4-deoxychorismate lyase
MKPSNAVFDEALMLDMNGFVAEGPGANFFFEKEGVLYTPPIGNIFTRHHSPNRIGNLQRDGFTC